MAVSLNWRSFSWVSSSLERFHVESITRPLILETPVQRPCTHLLGCLLLGCHDFFELFGFHSRYNTGVNCLTFRRSSEVSPVYIGKTIRRT